MAEQKEEKQGFETREEVEAIVKEIYNNYGKSMVSDKELKESDEWLKYSEADALHITEDGIFKGLKDYVVYHEAFRKVVKSFKEDVKVESWCPKSCLVSVIYHIVYVNDMSLIYRGTQTLIWNDNKKMTHLVEARDINSHKKVVEIFTSLAKSNK
eukprot:225834_1